MGEIGYERCSMTPQVHSSRLCTLQTIVPTSQRSTTYLGGVQRIQLISTTYLRGDEYTAEEWTHQVTLAFPDQNSARCVLASNWTLREHTVYPRHTETISLSNKHPSEYPPRIPPSNTLSNNLSNAAQSQGICPSIKSSIRVSLFQYTTRCNN